MVEYIPTSLSPLSPILPFPKYEGAKEVIVEFENHKDRGFIPQQGMTFTKWLNQTYPIEDGLMVVPRKVEELVREFFMVVRPKTEEFTYVKLMASTPHRSANMEKYVKGSPWTLEKDMFFHVFRRWGGFGGVLKKIISKRPLVPALLNEVPYYIIVWDMSVEAKFTSDIPYPIQEVPGKTNEFKEIFSRIGKRRPGFRPRPIGPPGMP